MKPIASFFQKPRAVGKGSARLANWRSDDAGPPRNLTCLRYFPCSVERGSHARAMRSYDHSRGPSAAARRLGPRQMTIWRKITFPRKRLF